MSCHVFGTKVLIGDTISNVSCWRRDGHFTWSSEPREAICRAKVVPSFLSHVKTLSVGLVPGIEPATSRSAVRDSLIPTELILCCGLVIQFILFQREVQCEFGEMDQKRWVAVYGTIFMIPERLSFWNESILVLFTRYWTTFHVAGFVHVVEIKPGKSWNFI